MVLLFVMMIMLHYVLSYLGIYVDVVFVFVFWVNCRKGLIASLVYSFLSGMYMDFYYTFPFGVCSLTLTLLSYFIGNLRDKIELQTISSRFIGFVGLNYFFEFLLFVFSFVITSQNYFGFNFFYLPFINFIFFELIRTILDRFFTKRGIEIYA
jgi:rod shape-determining protein MreD